MPVLHHRCVMQLPGHITAIGKGYLFVAWHTFRTAPKNIDDQWRDKSNHVFWHSPPSGRPLKTTVGKELSSTWLRFPFCLKRTLLNHEQRSRDICWRQGIPVGGREPKECSQRVMSVIVGHLFRTRTHTPRKMGVVSRSIIGVKNIVHVSIRLRASVRTLKLFEGALEVRHAFRRQRIIDHENQGVLAQHSHRWIGHERGTNRSSPTFMYCDRRRC
mmetsp:Transcript_64504/g.179484  ORF Transcript_64504/g.179484 Transcript_64504/m.179484 type:complete len:216 (-) Transcript_64504:780-1427(-)